MQLEINKEHKKADLTKKKLRRLFRGSALGLTILATIYSGASKAQAEEIANNTSIISEQDDYNDDIINIPEKFNYDIHYDTGKEQEEPITTSDLQKIDHLFLSIEDGDDLSWLQYCTNIREIIINFKTDNIPDLSFLQSLNNLESFSVSCFPNTYNDFSQEKFAFLSQCKSVKNLYILGFENIEPGFLESLTNLDKITLSDCTNQNIDYSKLTFLKELDFSNTDPYDLPVFFTNKEYNILKSNGVNIKSADNNLEKSLEIGDRLDNIVNSLGITETDTEKEKLDKILIYVLENLEYDEMVSQALLNNTEHTDLTKDFYTEGNLYGALEKDSAICGNYSALVSALCKRVGVSNYYLISNNHAWNLVEIDGTDYYVDATWLDDTIINKPQENATYDENGNMTSMEITFETTSALEYIKEGKTDNLDWYLENPNDISQIDKKSSHEVVNFPSFIEIKEIEEPETELQEMQEEYEAPKEELPEEKNQTEKVEEFKKKKFEVKICKKVFIIGGTTLLGILGGLGAGIAIHHNNRKKRERERRRREQLYNEFYGYNDNSDFSSHRRHR